MKPKIEIVNGLARLCEEIREQQVYCLKRPTGASFVTDEYVYFGVSGNPNEPCTKKGYCQRENSGARSIGKYDECPSSCSESMAMLAACREEVDMKESFLVSTDFPCGRCTAIITDKMAPGGMRNLYFLRYGKGIRPKEQVHGRWLSKAGIDVFQLVGGHSVPQKYPQNVELPLRSPASVFLELTETHRASEIEDISQILEVKMPVRIARRRLPENWT